MRLAPPPVKTQPAPRASKHAAVTEVVAEHGEEFAGAGLEDLGEEALADEAGALAFAADAYAADLDLGELRGRW